jgi:hypothetical protein
MERRQQGFVFSLDAFVAFSLILIAIQSIVIVSSSPAGYYPSLLQAQFLAKDTLHTVSVTRLDSGQSVLADASGPISRGSLLRSDRIIEVSDKIIQPPYSYTYSYYDLEKQAWTLVYNASADPSDPRSNITYRRVAASAEQLMLEYSTAPVRPESPYCNVMCRGWVGNPPGYTDRTTCTKTPCDAQSGSLYQTGNLTFGLLRLTVWG